MYKMKRLFDVLTSLVILLVSAPVLIVVGILVWRKIGWPVLFVQKRPGINGVPFYMYKFRTMSDSVNNKGELLPDNVRLTAFGKSLRSTSLDELPEFWNILKGDMSLVGPRPLLMEYLPLYSNTQKRRHEVRPGLTGWAQINGRNCQSWESRFEYDIWYVDNKSFWLDMKILCLTVKKVLVREGVSQNGHVTMEKFKGNN